MSLKERPLPDDYHVHQGEVIWSLINTPHYASRNHVIIKEIMIDVYTCHQV